MERKSWKITIAALVMWYHDFLFMAMLKYCKVNFNRSQTHIISRFQAQAIPSAHGPRTISGEWRNWFQSLNFPLASGCQFMHLFNWATILADTGKAHAFPNANPNSRAVKLSSDSNVVGLHPMILTFSCCGIRRGGPRNGVEFNRSQLLVNEVLDHHRLSSWGPVSLNSLSWPTGSI